MLRLIGSMVAPPMIAPAWCATLVARVVAGIEGPHRDAPRRPKGRSLRGDPGFGDHAGPLLDLALHAGVHRLDRAAARRLPELQQPLAEFGIGGGGDHFAVE